MRKLFLILMTLIACSWSLSAQTRTYHGTVLDATNNEPLVGATIMPIGGGQGAATDADGKFTLNVPASVKQAKVSYVGYAAQTVHLKDGMTIRLASESSELDDVIVVAYGTAKKSEYTGAASVVDASTIEDRLVTNVTNALTGAVAGVQTLSSNGQPGVGASVLIRGVGSINAGSTPLYVLDGVPYDGDIAALNPNDIESMTVLKDAAAAALYGARGANGVILMTTKRGKSGKAKITVDAKWGANSRQITNYDVIRDPATFMELSYAAQKNAAMYHLGYTPQGAHDYANNQIYTPASGVIGYRIYTLPDGQQLIGTDGKLNPNATLGYKYKGYYFTPDNWEDESFRNGFRHEYNLSVSGATDRFNYYLNGSYTGDEGVIKNSSYKRLSTRLNLEYQATNWLKLGTNISYAYAESDYPRNQTSTGNNGNVFWAANNMAPVYPMYVRDESGQIMIDQNYNQPIYDFGDAKSTPYTRPKVQQANPVGQMYYDSRTYLTDLFNGKWYAQINPFEGFTLTGTAGFSLDNTRFHQVLSGIYGQFTSQKGNAQQQFERTQGLTLQAIANYRHSFNDIHNMELMLGYESYEWKDEYVSATGTNLYNPFSWAINNTLINDGRRGYGAFESYATRGIIAQANYNFMTRYFFTAMYRRDASSRFAPDHRWGNFFSVSAAWDIAKEKFMEDSRDWLNQLKLRASFGQQGNDNIGNNWAYVDQYSIEGATSWSDGQLVYKGNPDLTWETSNSFNVGVDFAFLNGMLTGSLEYFNRETSDMLYYRPVALSLGYDKIPMNIGSMRNYGAELELNYHPIRTKNIDWSINFNGTLIGNKIIKLAPELNGEYIDGSRIYREGESMYSLYLVKYAGVDPATGKALYWGWQYDANDQKIDGSYGIKDTYDTKDRQATGNLYPKFYGGFGTTLNAYGFDLTVALSFQVGGKIFDSGYQSLMGSGVSTDWGGNWHKDILNAWTPENRYTDVPRLDAQEQNSFSSYLLDRGLISSNYLGLNNITLGYTLPSSLTRKIGIDGIRVYCSADNIALWSARKGLDPRQSFVSASTSTYTAMRCISGGIKIEF